MLLRAANFDKQLHVLADFYLHFHTINTVWDKQRLAENEAINNSSSTHMMNVCK